MKPAIFTTYSAFGTIVEDALDGTEGPRLMAMLFMRKGQSVVDKEITPSLKYFDIRSAQDLHFVCPGWTATVDGWTYDDTAFSQCVSVIESNSSWVYSGGVELLLFTAQTRRFSADANKMVQQSGDESVVDLSSAITLHLDSLREKKLVDSLDRLFEIIIRFARNYKGESPVRGLAFQEARVSVAKGISDSLMALVPKEAKEKVDYASEFAVKDLSAAKHKPMIRVVTTTMHALYPP